MTKPTECAWLDLSVYTTGEIDVSYRLSEESRLDLVDALRQMADALESGEDSQKQSIH